MTSAARSWWSPRLEQDVTMARWGHYGPPLLLLPTAGGDAQEVERCGLIGAIQPLIDAGRVKVYSCDSVAGRRWLERRDAPWFLARLQNRFAEYLRWELVPAIRDDGHGDGAELIAAGASIGAFNAVAAVCRFPDAFRAAIGMSGTYDLAPWLNGEMPLDFYYSSPLHYLSNLDDGPQLDALRGRFIVLASGEGRWETPEETWRMAHVLGAKAVPNRVDLWGSAYDHDWPTWFTMLPTYLDQLL